MSDLPVQTDYLAIGDFTEKVVLLLDQSSSMDGCMPTEPKLKIQAAVEGARSILNASDPELTKYAILGFEDTIFLYSDMTNDLLALNSALTGVQSSGCTNMSDAILCGLDMSPDRMILLTDGQPDSKDSTLAAANSCALLNVKIDTIGIGDADDEFLQEISRRTGGIFHRAKTTEELNAIFVSLETSNRLMIGFVEAEKKAIEL